ncbi:MAG: thioredoxin [Bacteroidales bacterium]
MANKTKFLSFGIALSVVLLVFLGYSLTGNGTANEKEKEAKETSADASGHVLNLDAEGFDEAIAEGVVLVDFWATWCAPCRTQGPIIDDLAAEISNRATISKLDVDDHGSIASRYGISSIPTLLLFKNGEEVERFVGVQQKETLQAAIEKHLGKV